MNRGRNILSLSAIQKILFRFLVIVLLFGCEKFEPERIIKIATGSVTNVSYASCSVQGTIIDKGEKGIDQHGFCWSITQNPTTGNNSIQLGSKSSTGNFSGNLMGLSANTTHYVRAYAQNKDGVFYGDQESFSTLAFKLPTVTTTSVSNTTENSAQSGGNITDNGGSSVTARGVCWSISQNPTITDDHTTDGSGTGSFTSSLTGLTQNTTYYVRAYATNSVGTAYGDEVNFTTEQTIVSPTVTTSSASDIAETSATISGNVTADGGATVTERGVYYSTSASPETTGTKLQIGSGTGTFSTSLTGLSAGTIYYIKAYATNSIGTAYGNEVSFKTWFGAVTDYDGNVYETVQIGNQVWMAENLKVTHYPDGTTIQLVEDNSAWDALGYIDKAYCYYNNSSFNKDTYGALYTWAAAMNGASSSSANPSGVQGVCPDGWHLPSDAEWTELIDYLGGSNVAGGKMKETGTTHWDSPNTGATNSSGFTALPGGEHSHDGYFYSSMGDNAYFWSATETTSSTAWSRTLGDTYSEVYRGSYYNGYGKGYGFSVRCLRD